MLLPRVQPFDSPGYLVSNHSLSHPLVRCLLHLPHPSFSLSLSSLSLSLPLFFSSRLQFPWLRVAIQLLKVSSNPLLGHPVN